MPVGTSFIMTVMALAAQGSHESERMTLLQISLAIPETGAAEYEKAMEEETAKITSCADGLKFIDGLKARVRHGSLSFTVKTDVAIATLPVPLSRALLARPIGKATPVFGGGEAFRVLVRCEPTFVAPRPAPSSRDGSAVATS
ncbi:MULTISPECIES: hypothetical protein [unclassified Sphingomonas]|uniref:hypothetical protein n=1 Tax=unclassified Sphingomonas TaxID=196159 RepID=UPI000A73894F|nr:MULTISPECIES: hypothetical protein [unclassified Sphingomonas]